MPAEGRAREIIRWVIGPAYMLTAVAIFWLWKQYADSRYIVYYGASACVILLTQLLEWFFPWDKSWRHPDDQFKNELLCTFFVTNLGHNAGRFLAYGLFGTVIAWWQPSGGPWWPTSLPFAVQVAIAFVFWEFGLYWNHRLMHSKAWRFHVLHHKLRRLSWVNSGYGHPVSFLMTSFADLGVLLLLGAPADVLLFVSFVSGSINFMSHCNVDMKMGLLNYIFVTPETHRWHHVNDPQSHGRNFGTQLNIWDLVFRTFYLPKDRTPDKQFGDDQHQPAGLVHQLLAPFMPKRAAQWPGIPAKRQLR